MDLYSASYNGLTETLKPRCCEKSRKEKKRKE